MPLWKFVNHVIKEGHRKKSMSLDNNFLQLEKTCNKYDIYFITNFMANILALRQNFIFWFLILKEDQKIIVSNVTVSNVTFCPSEKDTIAAWKNTTSWIPIHLIWSC